MNRNGTREQSKADDSRPLSGGRRVRIVHGPVALMAPVSAEGARRVVVVAGTVVLWGGTPVPAHNREVLMDRCVGSGALRDGLAERGTGIVSVR